MSIYAYLNSVVQYGIMPGLSRSLTLGLAATAAGGPVLQRLSPSFLATGEIGVTRKRSFLRSVYSSSKDEADVGSYLQSSSCPAKWNLVGSG